MKWVLADHDAAAVSRLADEAGIHPLIARLMLGRGIADAEAARSFFSDDISTLSAPTLFADMDRAVTRIRAAVSSGERIVIFGDYDVDGVTGSAILFLALRHAGADVSCYLPDRMTEGYGLNTGALTRLKGEGAGLVISVDCGISAVEQAAHARGIGLDLVITDHHEFANDAGNAGKALPQAVAVLHPKILASGLNGETAGRIGVLTGAGVAYKLAQAVLDAPPDDERITRYLDLAMLGTVADMGRITGENRIICRHGLGLLSSPLERLRPGIAALKQVSGLEGKRITVGTVGFSLGPRINASGRLERADHAFRLLTTDDRDEARRLAAALDAVNRERQAVEENIWSEARGMARREDMQRTGALVLASPDWHPGVVGIVASRIVDEFYRPAALIALKSGAGKGSARSIPGFDLFIGLTQCADLLKGFGGHKYAAGLSIAEEQIPRFRERLNKVALDSLGPDGFQRTITIDAPVSLDELTFDLLRDIERMGPFGQGNPEPRLGAKGLDVVSLRTVGSNRHLKLRLRQNGRTAFDAIAYGKAEALTAKLRTGSRVAVVFTPRINTWNGMSNIELEIRDLKVERQA